MADNNIFANNPFADTVKAWNENLAKMISENPFANAKAPTFDFNQFSEIQRRNVEAFNAANQIVAEFVQASARRQAEIAQSSIGESLQALKEVISSGNPEASATKQAELAKSLFEAGLNNSRELIEMASKSNIEALDLVNQRFSEAFSEISEAAANVANVASGSKTSKKKQQNSAQAA